MAGIDFAEVRRRVRLGQILELCGFVPRTRRGAQVRGPCPVHRSRSPHSRVFAAQLERQVWHCFGCRRGGNALDLWAARTGLRLYAAALDLCARLGIAVPWLARPGAVGRPDRGRTPMT
jgi:DNA primase